MSVRCASPSNVRRWDALHCNAAGRYFSNRCPPLGSSEYHVPDRLTVCSVAQSLRTSHCLSTTRNTGSLFLRLSAAAACQICNLCAQGLKANNSLGASSEGLLTDSLLTESGQLALLRALLRARAAPAPPPQLPRTHLLPMDGPRRHAAGPAAPSSPTSSRK